jgi:hypothetical protein
MQASITNLSIGDDIVIGVGSLVFISVAFYVWWKAN